MRCDFGFSLTWFDFARFGLVFCFDLFINDILLHTYKSTIMKNIHIHIYIYSIDRNDNVLTIFVFFVVISVCRFIGVVNAYTVRRSYPFCSSSLVIC